ncbi:MAG: polysaccharide export protein [Candidatus Omnitrophica bacterium]|nr:polysaccharide export protein [Candidatus Omnitrophota bacterium]
MFFLVFLLGIGVLTVAWGEEKPGLVSNPQPEEGYTLRPGDKLSVKVFREPDLTGVFVVDGSGTLNYPLLGDVRTEGMTLGALRNYLVENLGKNFLVNPQIEVTLEEGMSKTVSVLGQVSKPGNYDLEPGMTLIQLISEAGGFTPIANPGGVRIVRYSPKEDKAVSMSVNVGSIMDGNAKDVPLEPKDLVVVPESFF